VDLTSNGIFLRFPVASTMPGTPYFKIGSPGGLPRKSTKGFLIPLTNLSSLDGGDRRESLAAKAHSPFAKGVYMVPQVGLQCFHNGVPMELLYEVKKNIWKIRLLFVEGPDREEAFEKDVDLKPLHTQRSFAANRPC
jgi:hypothetical protein